MMNSSDVVCCNHCNRVFANEVKYLEHVGEFMSTCGHCRTKYMDGTVHRCNFLEQYCVRCMETVFIASHVHNNDDGVEVMPFQDLYMEGMNLSNDRMGERVDELKKKFEKERRRGMEEESKERGRRGETKR